MAIRNKPDPVLVATTGALALTFVVVTGVVAHRVISGPSEFGNLIPESRHALADRQSKFDFISTKTFRSVDECQRKGNGEQPCNQAFSTASAISHNWATSPNYKSQEECLQSHNVCSPVTQYEIVRTGRVHRSDPVTRYQPPMVAWQSALKDIEIVVPLYAGKSKDIVVRADGKEFRLDS
jgi:hypothetical protein